MAKPKKKGELDIPVHIMDDLGSRFVINNEKKLDEIQVFDTLENAHWHYIDFYCVQMKPPPPKCNLKTFSKHMLAYLTFMDELVFPVDEFESHYQEWHEKKRTTPCFGGILLTPGYKHVLMVIGFGQKTAWGFPKGKRENFENGIDCAIREIEEETGLNVSDKIREDRGIVQWIQDRFHKLYIITDIPEDTPIQAKLRREIKSHKWIPVHALPLHRNDSAPQQVQLEATDFFCVSPFVRPLRKWIEEQTREQQQQQQQQKSTLPASQFTAKGRRRGKAKDAQRRQSAPGPDGDASTSAPAVGQGQGRSNSRQSQVARSLGDQFSDVASAASSGASSASASAQADRPVRILTREESAGKAGGNRQQQDRDSRTDTGGSSGGGGGGQPAVQSIRAGPHTLRLDQFHSTAMLNFKFDKQSILDIFHWRDV